MDAPASRLSATHITSKKIKGLETKNYKMKQASDRKVPEGMPSVQNGGFIGNINGSRGVGKTNAVIRLAELYDQTHTFDKVILFSPSYRNDPKYQLLHNMKCTVDVYMEYSNDIFNQVAERISYDIDRWKKYEEDLKKYEKLLDWLKKHGHDIDRYPDQDFIYDLIESGYVKPQKPKDLDRMPFTLIIFDDLATNKDLYATNCKSEASKFFILHRHKLTSLLFVTQIWRNGVPRGIRNNLSLFILFTNKSDKIKQEIAEELSSYISVEDFIRLWDTAVKDSRFDFFMCDLDGDPALRYRKNFDTILTLEGK